jgi:hypothetical protein
MFPPWRNVKQGSRDRLVSLESANGKGRQKQLEFPFDGGGKSMLEYVCCFTASRRQGSVASRLCGHSPVFGRIIRGLIPT